MFWFIVNVVLILVGLLVLAKSRKWSLAVDEEVPVWGFRALGTVAIFANVLFIFLSSYTIVQPKNVGIVTTFGRLNNTPLNPGWHWVAPWDDVHTLDATLVTSKYEGDSKIPVRLANGSIAYLNVTVQWHPDDAHDTPALWQTYKGKDGEIQANLQHNVVDRQVRAELMLVFEQYDPLRAMMSPDGMDQKLTIGQLGAQAFDALKAKVDAGINVKSLTLGLPEYDAATQKKLDDYNQLQADTRLAEARKKLNENIVAANKVLAADKSTNDPGVQFQVCVDLVKWLVDHNKLMDLPPAFSWCGENNKPAVLLQAK